MGSPSKLTDIDHQSICSNDVEQVLKEALGQESKNTTVNDYSNSSSTSDPYPRKRQPKLFCASRKRNAPPEPNCFVSFFSKYFPEKASVGNGPGPMDGLNSGQRH